MLATLNWLALPFLAAAEGAHGIPGDDWRAKIALPIGIVLFIGSVYMLVRANLGTRRGYLVLGTSFFGFMVVYSLFWAFGAPGTPPATGPQNLPGQQLDAYEDTWRPFAPDSLVAEDPTYAVAQTHPEGFSETLEGAGLPAEFEGQANTGVGEILAFFATAEGQMQSPPIAAATWVELEDERRYAVAENGRPIVAATFAQTYQVAQADPGQPAPEDVEGPVLTPDGARVADDGENIAPPGTEIGDIVEGGETYTAFAYFDEGSPAFPSLLTLAIMFVLFVLHALLLAADERKERREREALAAEAAAAREERTLEPTG
ncbi:MAG TPA: hypothetical protein VM307_06155 [Egibacteraceae bacterium]|nr:hypothetical protein [Egibacteraceae bacterium]